MVGHKSMSDFLKNKFILRSIVLSSMAFLLLGCGPMHSIWYHPDAAVGYATNSECLRAGKNDEWVLKRQGVTIDIRPTLPRAGYMGAIGVSLHVPADLVVDSEVKRFLALGQAGDKLKGNFTVYASNYINGNYVNHTLSSNLHYLSGSRLATKSKPFTNYSFGLTKLEVLPTSFDVVLPRMEINGHKYPPLTIHFTKKPGWYFLEGINC